MPQGAFKHFSWMDVGEMVIGGAILAFPIAVTEEVWNLSTELGPLRVLLIVLGSLLALGWFGYLIFYRKRMEGNTGEFFLRVGAAYGVALAVAFLCLLGIDRLPVSTEPVVAIKQVIIVAFPASFAATVVDSLS